MSRRSPSPKRGRAAAAAHLLAKPIERGHMYVLFRPKVDVEEAHAFKDVQKLYVWLAPERVELADHIKHEIGKASVAEAHSARVRKAHREAPMAGSAGEGATGVKPMHRLLILPTKQFPTHTQKRPHWAFVEEASPNIEDIKNHLGEFHYITKTRGERTAHGSRIVAEALYEIAMDEEGKHSYLFYDLEFPHTPEEPQKAFNVEKEGIVLMQVKNPHAGREATREGGIPAGLQGKMKPHYPERLQKHFTGIRVAETKFASLLPEMLNFKGTELLLIGVGESAKDVLGAEELAFLEGEAEKEYESVHGKREEERKIASETGIEEKTALHKF